MSDIFGIYIKLLYLKNVGTKNALNKAILNVKEIVNRINLREKFTVFIRADLKKKLSIDLLKTVYYWQFDLY